MSTMTITVGANVRSLNQKFKGLNVYGNIAGTGTGQLTDGQTRRSDKSMSIESGWSHDLNDGINQYFQRHNAFHDQELYNRVSRGYINRTGTIIHYYATTFDPSGDPLYFEDNNRVIQRVFRISAALTFQPENEIYNKFNIQHLDESEMHVHMGAFLEANYQSLRNYGIKPLCDPNAHNPVWSQRGYENFSYHGYSFDQIGPKSGDKMKIEAFNSLYEIESVRDASPEFQHRWRKYFWRMFYKDAMDSGQVVSSEVINDTEQRHFIDTLSGVMTGATQQNGQPVDFPFPRNATIDRLKKDVLFRPPEVPQSAPDISKDSNFYPGANRVSEW